MGADCLAAIAGMRDLQDLNASAGAAR